MKITSRFYKVYPELALLDSDEDRRATLKALQRGLLRRPLFWLMSCGLGALNGLAPLWSRYLWIPVVSNHLPRWLVSMLPAILVGASLGLILQYAWRRPLQRRLREELVARGIPVCIACGYDLRGQTEPRCPECGREFAEALLRREDGDHRRGTL